MLDPSGAAGMIADRRRLEESLARLIAVPSVTADEHAVQDLVADLLQETGARVERLDIPLGDVSSRRGFPGIEVERESLPIVVGRLGGGRPGPSLMLQGHIDVVPPGDGWSTAPFEPVVRDGEMYGRGACDMKGGVAANLEAMHLVSELDIEGEVVFVSVPAEEDGGAGAFAAIEHGLVADACVITEPTNLSVIVAHGGAITFTLDVPGKAAHASMRREGVSALDNLAYLVEALRSDEAVRNAGESDPHMRALGLPYPTIIGQVEGGNWPSTVMDGVRAHGRYGVTIHQDGDGAAEDLTGAVEAAAAEHPFLGDHPPTVTVWGGRFDSCSLPPDHAVPRSLIAASLEAGYGAPEMAGAPYGADMRLYINHGNTPTVMYGPGDVAYAHAADERVPLAEVAQCAEVLARWLAGAPA